MKPLNKRFEYFTLLIYLILKMNAVVIFLTHFRGFSFFNLTLFTLVGKASFVILPRNLFHYMAESLESLFASHKCTQGLHAECGF